MGDHLAISGGLLQAPLNPLKTDVSRGPPGLSGGPGPLGPHHNSTTGGDNWSCKTCKATVKLSPSTNQRPAKLVALPVAQPTVSEYLCS